ncbi:hypothetical protein YPPY34_4035 [Yersinia pestis PY-34]|nr:hypothetical protein YPPY34_4035 [Yersinia pestis PY-34]EIS18452.1 hypothetical protein YPPY54_4157 [Yersinia pestis PY-54]EIS37239.1 hypothetical protein YPPY58_4082 [Yersinia pestis PY-58]EIT11539.1 hypothetical protein YPPY94_4060 [Yersinia pestis PY-94]
MGCRKLKDCGGFIPVMTMSKLKPHFLFITRDRGDKAVFG